MIFEGKIFSRGRVIRENACFEKWVEGISIWELYRVGSESDSTPGGCRWHEGLVNACCFGDQRISLGANVGVFPEMWRRPDFSEKMLWSVPLGKCVCPALVPEGLLETFGPSWAFEKIPGKPIPWSWFQGCFFPRDKSPWAGGMNPRKFPWNFCWDFLKFSSAILWETCVCEIPSFLGWFPWPKPFRIEFCTIVKECSSSNSPVKISAFNWNPDFAKNPVKKPPTPPTIVVPEELILSCGTFKSPTKYLQGF